MPIAPADKRDNKSATAKRPASKRKTYQPGPVSQAVQAELAACNGKPDAYQKTDIIQRLAPRYRVDPSTIRRLISKLSQ